MDWELRALYQLLLAIVLGGILGWQRERWAKPAGIRTYAFVTGGSTLFTLLSLHAFGTESPSRIAAQVVVGIGFIGAGTILHRENHIEGLTTAAGLWISAAIGMAIAAEWYVFSVLATLLVLSLLIIDEKKWLFQKIDPAVVKEKKKKNVSKKPTKPRPLQMSAAQKPRKK